MDYFVRVRLFGLASRSRSRRSAVRFAAAAIEAFLARAERSSGVMFCAAFLPPSRPKVRDTSVIAARTSAGIFIPIPQIVYLTGYGALTFKSWLIENSATATKLEDRIKAPKAAIQPSYFPAQNSRTNSFEFLSPEARSL